MSDLSLVGAWELVSDNEQGVMVCSDNCYSVVITRKDRPVHPGGEITLEQAAEAYNAVKALSGTYRIEGSKVKLYRVANIKADMVGKVLEMEISIVDSLMKMELKAGAPNLLTLMWRKVE